MISEKKYRKVLFQSDFSKYTCQKIYNKIKMNKNDLGMDYPTYIDKRKRKFLNTKIGHYIVLSYIGGGATGQVYKAIDTYTNKSVALKMIEVGQMKKEKNQYIRGIKVRLAKTQPQLMHLCNSQNIVKFIEIYQSKEVQIIVMEYCNQGSLKDKLSNKKIFTEREAVQIIIQIIHGVAQMHKNKIIHRDLKPDNILIHNGIFKIADFGFAKRFFSQQDIKQTTLGTGCIAAPQILNKKPYGFKTDIWAIGVIFYKMVTGEYPYGDSNNWDIIKQNINKSTKILKQLLKSKNIELSGDAISFLAGCLQKDSKLRLSWIQLLQHPLFKQKKEENSKLLPQFIFETTLKVKDYDILQESLIQNPNEQLQKLQRSLNNKKKIKCHNAQIQKVTKDEVERESLKLTQKDTDSATYAWSRETYLQCLKTEIILKQIIYPLRETLETSRKNKQFFYLLAARCLNNLSPIKEKLKDHKYQSIVKLQLMIEQLYNMTKLEHEKCSRQLKQQEDKISQIVLDRVKSMINQQRCMIKDKFLTGIEIVDYKKDEQIEYTVYKTKKILEQLKLKNNKVQPLIKLIKNYEKICKIRQKQLDQQNKLFKSFIANLTI